MKLTILGSGVMTPSKTRYPSSYLLEDGEKRVLLDCGFLTLARLTEYGINPQSIDAVAISHFHTDHFGGFLPLVHCRMVDTGYRSEQYKELKVFGPQTIEERCNKLREVMWPEPDEIYPLNFCEGEFKETIGSMEIESFPIKHVEWFQCLGYKIKQNGKTLVYTGDMSWNQNPETSAYFKDADYLLIEAASWKRNAGTHMNVEEAVEFAQKNGVKNTLLTHLRPDLVSNINEYVGSHSDSVRVCEDGMQIEI
jgi:ribonuclease BN (tRNA processing enzyme)